MSIIITLFPALVISVDIHSETIFFSLNNDRLQPHQTHHTLVRLCIRDGDGDGDGFVQVCHDYREPVQTLKLESFIQVLLQCQPHPCIIGTFHQHSSQHAITITVNITIAISITITIAVTITITITITRRSSSWFNHPSKLRVVGGGTGRSVNSSPSSSPSLKKSQSFNARLREHPLFKNPQGQNIMAKAFGITDHASLLHRPT